MLDGKESAYLSQWLARIDRNVPLGLELTDIRYTGFDRDRLYRLLSELEFFSHIKNSDFHSRTVPSQMIILQTPQKPKIKSPPAILQQNRQKRQILTVPEMPQLQNPQQRKNNSRNYITAKPPDEETGRQLTLDDLLADTDNRADNDGKPATRNAETSHTGSPERLIKQLVTVSGNSDASDKSKPESEKMPAFGEMPAFAESENGADVKKLGEFTAFVYENGEAAFFDGVKGITVQADNARNAMEKIKLPSAGVLFMTQNL